MTPEQKAFCIENMIIPNYTIDYSKKVSIEQVDKDVVETKFELYDRAIRDDLFTIPTSSNCSSDEYKRRVLLHTRAILLFEDPTIFAYAHFRINGKPVKLYPFQDVIINDKHPRIDIEGANQIGKSALLCVWAAQSFLMDNEKGWTVGLISQSMSKNSDNMRMVKQLLDNGTLEFVAGQHDNMSVMTRDIKERSLHENKSDKKKVLYSNTLVCGIAGRSSLGFSFDKLLLDEFEFWDNPEGLEYMYDQIFEPRTFATKGQIVIFSNPNGENFVSQNLQKRRNLKTGQLEWHVYQFTFLDRPGNTRDEYEQRKSNVHPIIFSSTMAAERTESSGAFLTRLEIFDSFDAKLTEMGEFAGKGKSCAFFLDVGAVHDQSVLTGMYSEKNEKGEQEVKEFYKLYYPQTYPLWRVVGLDPLKAGEMQLNVSDGWEERSIISCREVLEKFRDGNGYLPIFGADITGHAAILPLCQAAGIPTKDITFSGPKKWSMYERFKIYMAKRLFKRIKSDNWINGKNQNWEYQCMRLRIAKQKGGRYYTVHHEQEDDLDDATDSTVGCLSLIDEGMISTPSAAIITQENHAVTTTQEKDPEFDDFNKMKLEQSFEYTF
jgi:hypothetical protein